MLLRPLDVEGIAPQRWRNPETGRWEGEHAVVAGITGFGKTFLIKRFAQLRPYVVVHDPKRTFQAPGFHKVETLQAVIDAGNQVAWRDDYQVPRYPKIIYSPSRHELRDDACQQAFWEWLYVNGNRTAIADELTQVVDGQRMPDAFQDILTAGREKGLELWGLTQQPVYIPNLVFTQARAIYCFFLALAAHQKKMEGVLPVSSEQIAALEKGQFYYFRRVGWKRALGPAKIRAKASQQEA